LYIGPSRGGSTQAVWRVVREVAGPQIVAVSWFIVQVSSHRVNVGPITTSERGAEFLEIAFAEQNLNREGTERVVVGIDGVNLDHGAADVDVPVDRIVLPSSERCQLKFGMQYDGL
jgi:hypothetical protein